MSEELATYRTRPAWEVQSLQAYCEAHRITAAELTAAEAHARQDNNNLYTDLSGCVMGTGLPYGEYERITLMAWVERYRHTQQSEAE